MYRGGARAICSGPGIAHFVAVAPFLVLGGTDARHFAAKGTQCAIVRPPGGNLHGPTEWISKEDFFKLKDVLRDYLGRETKS